MSERVMRLAEVRDGERFSLCAGGDKRYTKAGIDFTGTFVKVLPDTGGEIKLSPNHLVYVVD
jgi:hypothetical protein